MPKMKKILIAILALIMIVSGAITVKRNLEVKKENDKFSEIQAEMIPEISEPVVTEETEKSAEEETEPAPASTYEAPQALLELLEEYPDCIGYIDIEGTNIHYPIMQNEDNEYYLHRDMDGESSVSGCIYMDSNHDISEKGLHTIYGHHMKNGSMFKDVSKFVDADYMKNHQEIRIKTADKDISLAPVYCYSGASDGTYRNVVTSHGQVIEFIKSHTGLEIDADDLYVLVTCSYDGADNRCYLYCIPE